MSDQGVASVEEVAVAAPLPKAPSTLRRSLRYGRTRIGVALTLAVLLLALLGPALAPHSPSALIGGPFAKPSGAAPLGTDYLGHDVLSRVLWGGRSVVWMAFAATTVGVGIGVVLGMLAGYSRGRLDDVIMRTMDVVLAFPQIVLVLLFVSVLGPKLWLIALLVAIAWIPGVARVTRGMTLEAASREFVEAVEVLGVPRRRILGREIVPNLISPLMVEFGLRLTWSIAVIAAISFLGFGVQPPAADWGLMINENRNGLTIQPWAVVVPTVCIAVFTIGTNLVAEGIGRAIAGIDRQVDQR
jgi:peptide/nickel transport system permease protein